jgi:hypothetical protein
MPPLVPVTIALGRGAVRASQVEELPQFPPNRLNCSVYLIDRKGTRLPEGAVIRLRYASIGSWWPCPPGRH